MSLAQHYEERTIKAKDGSILNSLSESLQRAVWLLSGDLELVFSTDYSKSLTGSDSLSGMSEKHRLLTSIRGSISQGDSCGCYKGLKHIDYAIKEISCEEGSSGYLITLTEGATSIIDRIKRNSMEREKVLCGMIPT